jgi:hypothetical protein
MRAIATAASVAALTLSAAPASADLASSGLAPCVVEDQSTPCVWDARHRGNGHGRSFRVNRQGEVKFISHAQAHELMMGGRRAMTPRTPLTCSECSAQGAYRPGAWVWAACAACGHSLARVDVQPEEGEVIGFLGNGVLAVWEAPVS